MTTVTTPTKPRFRLSKLIRDTKSIARSTQSLRMKIVLMQLVLLGVFADWLMIGLNVNAQDFKRTKPKETPPA